MKQHWALKRTNQYTSRVILGILIAYALLWIHPASATAQVIIFLVAISALAFDIGINVAGYIIQGAERKGGKSK